MSVHKVNSPPDLDSKIPAHLRCVSVGSLTVTSDPSQRCVKAVVVHKGPVTSSTQNNGIEMLKADIREQDPAPSTTEHTSIKVTFFGTLAKEFSQSARQGDVILLTDFTIKESPSFLQDKLHPCQLEMDGKDAAVYVCSTSAPALNPTAVGSKKRNAYVALNNLKPNTVVNVYGVVTFFKLPFPSKGSDYCSTIKITDPSDEKVICTIFAKKIDDFPVISKIGDIIRLHRFKVTKFGDGVMLMNSFGWSVITLDGVIDSPLVPRVSSKTFSFDESDGRRVQELRQWAAQRSLVSSDQTRCLSSVQPMTYFNLTCQLLAKSVMDCNCILLKVWDGTKCEHPLLKVAVPDDSLEGESTISKDKMNLAASVLVYDNHIPTALDLKPGTFLQFFNLHALPERATGQAPDQLEHLVFHLHSGSSYGRGLRSLPANSPEVQTLKSVLEKHVDFEDDVNDFTIMDVWYTPPEAIVLLNPEEPDRESGNQPFTVRTCEHDLQQVTLAEVKQSTPPLTCHVQARVKTYQPQLLYQCLKLFCSNCKTMMDIPDDSAISKIFQESLNNDQPCSEQWALSSSKCSEELGRTISMHISRDMVKEGTHSQLIFIQGVTRNEICSLAHSYTHLVPVRSENGRMTLMDLSAPFLFTGGKKFFGCKRCSLDTLEKPVFASEENLDEQMIATALGVQLMEYRFLFQFELEDPTDTLQAYLWETAEKFFHVSAVDASISQEVQDQIQTLIDTMQSEESCLEERPWLNLCLSAYSINDSNFSQVCYQITNTEIK